MPKGRLGTLIASRRQQAGLTQDQLSAMTDIHREAIAQVERGRTQTLGPDVTNQLAEGLPVTVEELCRAMGYNITGDAAGIPEKLDPDALRVLARYPRDVQHWIMLEAIPWLERAVRAMAKRR